MPSSCKTQACSRNDQCGEGKFCYQSLSTSGCCDFKLSVGKKGCNGDDDMCASGVCIGNFCRRNDGTCDLSMGRRDHPDCVNWGGDCGENGICAGRKASCKCDDVVKLSVAACKPRSLPCRVSGDQRSLEGTWVRNENDVWQVYDKKKMTLTGPFRWFDGREDDWLIERQFPWSCGDHRLHACSWKGADCPKLNVKDNGTHVLVQKTKGDWPGTACAFSTATCACK